MAIPIKVAKAFFPSLNQAHIFYTGILHDYREGQALNAKDQEEILNLIRSSQSPYPTEGSTVRVGRGLYGSPCFVAVDTREQPYYVSILPSLKKCAAPQV